MLAFSAMLLPMCVGAVEPAAGHGVPPPAAGIAPPNALSTDAGLRVVRVVGSAVRVREGERRALADDMRLGAGDIVELAQDAQAAFAIGDRGEVDAAGGTHLVVETQATTAEPDAPTILNLQRGDLHAVWNPAPGGAAPAPLYVYAANWRVELQPGEYFLQRGATHSAQRYARLCVVDGDAVFRALDAARHASVAVGKCVQLQDGTFAETSFQTQQQVALRSQFTLPAPLPAAPAATADARRTAGLVQAPKDERSNPSTVAATLGAWAINVASYDDPDVAERQRQRLTEAGYPAVVVSARVDGQTWYRVQLPGFEDRDEARARVATLESGVMAGRSLWVTRQR